jgi:cation transport regulator ChaC
VRNYFAYGSNMSRARLEERTGGVIHRGRALLAGYVHRFDHQGRDGTAKGNIAVAADETVHGVLYQLSGAQEKLLAPFEGGYKIIMVELQLLTPARTESAFTYISVRSSRGLSPLTSYLEHYLSGMVENDFPEAYVETIRRQATR